MTDDTITFKELIARATRGGSSEGRKEAARQVQHWVSSGILELVGVDPPQRRIGRGHVRQYPTEAAFWCALFHSMANRGMTDFIPLVASTLGLQRRNIPRSARLIERAIKGTEPDVFVLYSLREDEGPVTITTLPLNIDNSWEAGLFLNLTKIFERARI